MMNKKEKIITLVTNSLSLLLALLVLVPFGKSSVSNGEVVFKLLVAPICILAIFIVNSYIKYVVGTNEYKYTSLSAYLGLFAYVVALFAYTIETMLRTGASVVYATSTFVVLVAIFACIAAIFAAMGIYMQRFVIFLKSKECIFLDIVLVLLVVAITIVMRLVLLRHVGVPMDSSVLQYIVVPLLFGLAVILVLVFVLLNYLRYNEKFAYYSRKELLEKWNSARDEVYHQALVDILFNLYNFSKNELGITEEAAPAVEEAEEEQEAAEEAEEEPVGVAEEEQPQVDPEELAAAEARLEELQKQKEELINEGAPEEQSEPVKVAYPPKTFKPTFAELVRYASNLKDVTFQANEEGSNYKFFVGKKVFLIMVDGPKSYKMTFLMDLPDAAEYSQLVAFSKAKSPKGEYSFKLVNKGTFEASELKKIIKNARHMIDVIEERKQAAKEAEKARKAEEKLQAKLASMTPEERAKYLKRLENAKKTPEQKAKEAEEKRLAKEAEKAKKEEEKAKKAAEKAAKEAEKAAKEAEKAQEQQPAEPAAEEPVAESAPAEEAQPVAEEAAPAEEEKTAEEPQEEEKKEAAE